MTASRASIWRCAPPIGRDAPRDADIDHVEDLLWQTAVALEHGGLLTAAEELRRLQALLAQAMANGAPQEVIDALLQRYNEAMQRYGGAGGQRRHRRQQPAIRVP